MVEKEEFDQRTLRFEFLRLIIEYFSDIYSTLYVFIATIEKII
jgi:hypothetical protein